MLFFFAEFLPEDGQKGRNM